MLHVYLLAREFTCMHNYVLHWYCMQAGVDARNTQIHQQTAEIQGKEAEINRLQRQLRVRIKKTLFRNRFHHEMICVYRIKLFPESREQLHCDTNLSRSVDNGIHNYLDSNISSGRGNKKCIAFKM